jgi:hypothetical protein
MRSLVALVIGIMAAACGGTPSAFIATQSDFAGYAAWERYDLGMAMNGGHPIGPQFVYRSGLPANGRYPVASILVKEIQIGTLPQQWELFGMVKRGGNFNPNGARDWEFFTLKLNDDGLPIILTRGANPADSDSQGHGYAAAVGGVTCNRCHGLLATQVNDHVLSPPILP